MKANLDVNQWLRRPFQSIQSLCAFRLPTVLTLPSPLLHTCVLSLSQCPCCVLSVPSSCSTLISALVFILFYTLCIPATAFASSHRFHHGVALHHGRRTHTATAKEPQVESPQHTHLTLKNHPGSEGPTRYHTSALVKTATKAKGRATQLRGPPDN